MCNNYKTGGGLSLDIPSTLKEGILRLYPICRIVFRLSGKPIKIINMIGPATKKVDKVCISCISIPECS